MELNFNLHGVTVAADVDHPGAAALVRRRLSPYVAAPAADPRVTVRVRAGDVNYPVPLHALRTLRYGRLRNYYLAGASFFTDYFSTMTVSGDGRRIQGNFSPETEQEVGIEYFVDLIFTLALFEALRFHGRYYVHAAALQGPDGVGYLISGNCGAGKTSLTLALIQTGFKYLSDDTVFLGLGAGRDVTVHGFARDFHVPADLLAEAPYLRGFEGEEGKIVGGLKKVAIEPDRLSGSRLDQLTNPAVILFSELAQSQPRLEPISRADAMALLVRQSPSVTFHPTPAANHLEALRRVIISAKAFRLAAGPELKGSPARCRQIVEAARDLARKGDLP